MISHWHKLLYNPYYFRYVLLPKHNFARFAEYHNMTVMILAANEIKFAIAVDLISFGVIPPIIGVKGNITMRVRQ